MSREETVRVGRESLMNNKAHLYHACAAPVGDSYSWSVNSSLSRCMVQSYLGRGIRLARC